MRARLELKETAPADRRARVRNVVGVGAMRLGLAGWALALCAAVGLGQERAEPLPDAPEATVASSNSGAQLGAAQDIDVSWKNFPTRILHDQKDIWLFPLQLAKGHYLIPSLAVAGGTAGLGLAGRPRGGRFWEAGGGLGGFLKALCRAAIARGKGKCDAARVFGGAGG